MRFRQVTICKKMDGSSECRRLVLEGQSKVAKNRKTDKKKKKSRHRMKLKKRAVLSAHEELVRE